MGGDTSTNKNTDGARQQGRSRGYMRSKGPGGTEDIGLRSDIGIGRGVVTVIECDQNPDSNVEGGRNVRRFGSQKTLGNGSGWRSSDESKRSYDSATRETDWANGIRQTTVSTQVVN